MNLSTECAISNSRSRQLLQIVNGIYKRVHLKLIPRSLPGLKSEISKNLSNYKITNIQFDWYEHWKVHEIGIEDPIFINMFVQQHPIRRLLRLLSANFLIWLDKVYENKAICVLTEKAMRICSIFVIQFISSDLFRILIFID